ncbi:hypothetical protein DAPPUDRAFT_333388 [Daphnia pulex]|uniref:Retrotransposon Copia-like N-terminal domain-containing protein n=1 Tax=Daphnia pulex TaxID=6669 RepID=E9HSP5_DAPPU|nr:hypothetical protein DAPPUDRAFT_333388 [Daphnia pulex]|eukprot:EFX65240.1 hypothetical protein DAPPUDRAFT_333388 [Daphnia pulex]
MANHEGNGNNLIFQAKFNGTRFSQWKFGALIMARAKKLVGIIEGTEQKPVEEYDEEGKLKNGRKFNTWIERDAMAAGLIYGSLEPEY